MNLKRKPVHPGQFLREEFLEPYKITQASFAQALALNRVTVSKILNERQKITPDVAIRLSKCLGTTPEVWLNMQTKVELWEELHNKPHQNRLQRVKNFLWMQQQVDAIKSA
jgi:addiction module HigA family antidote